MAREKRYTCMYICQRYKIIKSIKFVQTISDKMHKQLYKYVRQYYLCIKIYKSI